MKKVVMETGNIEVNKPFGILGLAHKCWLYYL